MLWSKGDFCKVWLKLASGSGLGCTKVTLTNSKTGIKTYVYVTLN